MKNGLFAFLLPLLLITTAFTQPGNAVINGEVTFVTSRNVYVKFVNTSSIEVGDTLRTDSKPCLVVENKSSSSCVCVTINGCEMQKGDQVSYLIHPKQELVEEVKVEEGRRPEKTEPKEEEEEEVNKQRIRGRISVSEYSNIGLTRDDRHRMMARFSLNADHIANSAFSFETYMNYRRVFPTDTADFTPQTSMFRIYSLAARYETPGLSVALGRRINPKIASLGAIDGVQVEKRLGALYLGAIVGSRPDLVNFSHNTKLMEYGGYAGVETTGDKFRSLTTLGMIEQKNDGATDRRYAYFQHSGTIANNLSLFSSAELDLFSLPDSMGNFTPRLTNLYLSAVYRFSRAVNLMASYDSRKRIVYYETYQTEIERLLDDDIARQGVRVRLNIRPAKYVSTGLSVSRRFQSDQQNKSENVYVYGTLSKILGVGGRLTVSYNMNASGYLNSTALSVRHSRSMIDGNLSADVYYRLGSYTYKNSESPLRQHYFGTNLSYNITRRVMVSVSGERATFNGETNYRLYFKLVGRIYSK